MITEITTSNEPHAIRRAGRQKRARNMAAEEVLIEVISGRKWKNFGDKGIEHSIKKLFTLESALE